VTFDGVVERTVEIIQQFDDLYRTTFRRQRGESDDIREVDRRARIHLWSHTTSRLQLVGNKTTSRRSTEFTFVIILHTASMLLVGGHGHSAKCVWENVNGTLKSIRHSTVA